MKRLLISSVILLIIGTFAYGQSSQQFLHPKVWLRADRLDSITSYWKDVSGHQHNGNFAKNETLPPLSTLNYNPCFFLDENRNGFLVSYNLGDISKMSVVIVYQTPDSILEQGIWSVIKDTSKIQCLTTHKVDGESFAVKYADKNNTAAIVNALNFSWKEKPIDTVKEVIHIGGTDSLYFHGKVAECLVYHDVLKRKDVQSIQSYLCLKYGITLQGLNYVNSKNKIYWNHSENLGYNNGIIGIGRDTTLDLNQKQSTSTSTLDILSLGASAISQTNESNSYVINEGDFMLCGNNNVPTSIQWLDTGQTMGLMQRHWLMQVTGGTVRQIPTALKVNLSELLTDSMTCHLVISESVDSGFVLTNLNYFMPDSITENKVAYFNNIYWDNDGDGKDLFSFYFTKEAPLLSKPPVDTTIKRDSIQSALLYNNKSNVLISDLGSLTTNNKGTNSLDQYSLIRQNENQANGGLSNTSQQNSYILYPNPSKGTFDLEANLKTTGWIIIQITDNQGKVIETFSKDNQLLYKFTGKIDVPGTYYVDVRVEGEHKVFPLIIQ